MMIQILCFASAQDITGSRELVLECPDGATVSDCVRKLTESFPRMAEMQARLRYAVDEEFVAPETPLRDGATLALLPPMSGG